MHDGDWADNTTVITANTSEHSFNGGLVEQLQIQPPKSRPGVRRCSQLCWVLTTFLISFAALVSAPLMAAAPFIATYLGFEWPAIQCEIDCQGNLLAMFIMTVLLVIFFWLTYWRRAPALMPRLFVPRAGFSLFVLFILFAFWLFYATRILIERYPTYPHIVWFALALVLTLLVVNVIWIVHNFLQLRPAFYVTIIRDPDGESHTSEIGQMSIQEAAVQVLRDYHTLFSTYNPYMDRLKSSEGAGRFRGGGGSNVNAITGMKVYDIDGTGQTKLSQDEAKLLMVAAARRRANGHNDLFYDEMDRTSGRRSEGTVSWTPLRKPLRMFKP
ncbi:VANG-1 protein [Aphelenchoides avenae]|nr:VANG-1 protein [Aphelenchus avenae]